MFLSLGRLKALLYYATCLAILLQQALHEVESCSTFRNACCNNNIARLDDCDVYYTLQSVFVMYVNLAIATQVARQVA
jgi:hypothetical protein